MVSPDWDVEVHDSSRLTASLPVAGLPVLLVNAGDPDRLKDIFEGWGAAVTSIAGVDGAVPLDEIREWIGGQPVRTRHKER